MPDDPMYNFQHTHMQVSYLEASFRFDRNKFFSKSNARKVFVSPSCGSRRTMKRAGVLSDPTKCYENISNKRLYEDVENLYDKYLMRRESCKSLSLYEFCSWYTKAGVDEN